MSDIPAELSLDVSSALAAVASVEAALVEAAGAFQASVEAALGTLDVAGTEIAVEVDAGSITEDIDAAVSASDATVAVDASVTADTSAAQASIDELEGETIEVAVVADTSEAQSALDDLGASGTGAASGLGAAEQAAGSLAVGTAALTGNFAALTGRLSNIGPAGAAAGVAITALAVAGKTLVGAAIDSESSLQRFNLVLGSSAAAVRQIDLGGLNEDLQTLAVRLGSDDEALQNAVSRLFSFGIANGTARREVEQTAEGLTALAARAVALNPSLGEVGDTVGRLTQALATGRNLADFGLQFNRAQVQLEAFAQTGKTSADELTRFDLVAAATALNVKRLGDSLATDINAGAQNVAIQFRAVQQEIQNTIESAGAPLLGPVLDLFQGLAPVIEPIAEALGSVLAAVIPLANAFANILVPVLELVAPAVEAIAKPLDIVAGAVEKVTSVLGAPVRFLGNALGDLVGSADEAAAGVSAAADEIVSAFARIGTAGAGIGNVGAAIAGALAGGTEALAARDRLVATFQGGLPQIGDAFAVEAARVGSSAKSIDRSADEIISAADDLAQRFAAGLPSISDAFGEGVSPEDLRDAKNTLEAFIQGVEGVGKSAADSAQAVIDKAATEGGTGLSGFLQKLREQTAEIASFQATIAALRGRGALDLAGVFAERGIEAAAVAAEAAGLSQTDLEAAERTAEAAKSARTEAVANMGIFADELVATFGPKGAEAGAMFGEGLVTNLASPEVLAQARDEAAKIAAAAAEGGGGGGGAAAPPPQTLAGFLAALRAQSGDIQAFQDDLNEIADEGGTVLAATLREQGITAARAAEQAAALAPAQLLAAEQAVRDAQGVLATAQADNEAAAAFLTKFMADTARNASKGFTDNFIITIGPTLGALSAEILAAAPPLVLAAGTTGALVGTAFGDAFEASVTEALQAGVLAGLIGGATSVGLPALFAPAGASQITGVGFQPPAVAAPSGPAVNIENIIVTPPRDATAEEQADAISEEIGWRLQRSGIS